MVIHGSQLKVNGRGVSNSLTEETNRSAGKIGREIEGKSKSRIPFPAVIPIEKPFGRLVRSRIRVKC